MKVIVRSFFVSTNAVVVRGLRNSNTVQGIEIEFKSMILLISITIL